MQLLPGGPEAEGNGHTQRLDRGIPTQILDRVCVRVNRLDIFVSDR
jgi:hypothetical protein